jgi:hypothetical protein
MQRQESLLILAVIAVGVLHTLVPDHWVPITVLAHQRKWTRRQTARAAFVAGFGHTISTLAIGLIVWAAGLALALHFGHLLSLFSSIALITFGSWTAVASLREPGKATPVMALPLILGSSPMVEGIPAFFAAARFGPSLLATMAILFALSTIATYVALCVYSTSVLQRFSLGPLERYGEVLSGAFIALVGVVFLIWPIS